MITMESYTASQMKDIERKARETYGIPEIIMMENASIAVAHTASELMLTLFLKEIYIFCGCGNNGGDGLAAGRHLVNKGYSVNIILVKHSSAYGKLARMHLDTALKMGIPATQKLPRKEILEHSLIIDALLGTGINGTVMSPYRELIDTINKTDTHVLSVDIPSGLDADTGKPLGSCVYADTTVTMFAPKTGMLKTNAHAFTGSIIVGDIGIPKKRS
ncbi:MAG: NAD(P)H-hydrate epimerase [bacterium]